MRKVYKIPSRSEPGRYRLVTVDGDRITCDCPATKKECFHIRAYRRWIGRVKGDIRRCFYSHSERNLEEHHLLRAADREMSITIYISHWVHRLATVDGEFAGHLIDLFMQDNKNMELKFKATVKEVTIRNLVSLDKGFQFTLHTHDIDEAMKLAHLEPEQLVKISFRKMELYATLVSVKKTNLKEENDRAEMKFESAPAEANGIAVLALLPVGEEVEAEYHQL